MFCKNSNKSFAQKKFIYEKDYIFLKICHLGWLDSPKNEYISISTMSHYILPSLPFPSSNSDK